MEHDNLGLCNKCRARVAAEFLTRDGQVWIRKDCPECGPNESLVSCDAAAWQAKRDLWNYVPKDRVSCSLKCDQCHIDHQPNMVFLDVTNRCNMNCPICIATIRDMGFDFNPPLEYFEKIFKEIGAWNPRPMVELFGGEPTVRDDLLEIIALGRKYGLKPRIVTNGLRLADEAYCQKLCAAGVRMRFAFDGRSADIYERLRHNRPAYARKVAGLENLRKHSRRRQTLISCAAWGVNDQHLGDLIQYCHENRDLIADIGIIPLTENWKPGEFDATIHTTTMEDVEKMVKQCITGGDVEFVPAGLSYAMRKPRSFLRENSRSEILLLGGVHPNCESMTLLYSDGRTYRSVNYVLKKPLSRAAAEFVAISNRIEPQLARLDPRRFFQRQRGKLLMVRAFLPWVLGTVRFGRVFRHALADLGGIIANRVGRLFAKGDAGSERRPHRLLRLAVLPFEELHSIDAGRMENCKAVFAYEDTDDHQVKTVPACMWYPYRNGFLEKLARHYGVARNQSSRAEAEATATK